jgi:LPXTG-motif cell wall-anchored protein
MKKLAASGLVAVLGTTVLLFSNGIAQAADVTIPINTFLDELTGSTTLVASAPSGTFEGRTCEVLVNGVNNDSVHLNNNIITSSGGGEVTAFNVERAPLVNTPAAGQLVLGATIEVSVLIGNADSGSNGDGTTNGFFSGGHAIEVTCLPVVTSTTTTTTTTTTLPEESSTTTTPPGEPSTTVAASTTSVSVQPPPAGGDGVSSATPTGPLPETGSSSTIATLLAALALIAGGFLLVRTARHAD